MRLVDWVFDKDSRWQGIRVICLQEQQHLFVFRQIYTFRRIEAVF